MEDRRPENDELREAIEQHDEGVAGTHQYDEIVPIARMWLNDPVSLVRRAVESGTIKGEVVEARKDTTQVRVGGGYDFLLDAPGPGPYLVVHIEGET